MFISTVVVRAIIAEVENRGGDVDRLLRAASLDRASLHRPSEGVRPRAFDRLVHQALELTHDPALGLSLGARAPESVLHVLGMLISTSRTLRDAYEHVRRYGALVVAGMDLQLGERAELASFGYACSAHTDTSYETARFGAECALALTVRMWRHFVPNESPLEVHFSHDEPPYAGAYQDVFGCPVRFRQARNAMIFRRALLDRAQPHTDPQLSAMLIKMAETLQQQASGATSFADRVRTALRYETDLANFDFDNLATRWGVTRRVLRRRLGSEGESLSNLLDEARCARAVEELRRPGSKIKEVAEDLGYSETSAFHRAFKRWTGSTPSLYKLHLRTGAHAEAAAS